MKTSEALVRAAKDLAGHGSAIPGLEPAPTKHAKLIAWVKEIAALTKPERIHWCDGSDAEFEQLTAELIALGTLKRLNPAKRPNSFYAASDPKDVARVEHLTFVCTRTHRMGTSSPHSIASRRLNRWAALRNTSRADWPQLPDGRVRC